MKLLKKKTFIKVFGNEVQFNNQYRFEQKRSIIW